MFPLFSLITKFRHLPAILDTGTTLNYVPTDVIELYANKFVPPAVFDDDVGAYVVNCRARVPPFTVTIGGKTFTIDGRDQILPIGTDDSGKEVCILGTMDGGPNVDGNIFILCVIFTSCCAMLIDW